MTEELISLEGNQTWDLIPILDVAYVIGSK